MFPLAPLHGLFALLTFLGIILLMVWIIRYAKKENLMKCATWFLIIGIVGCIAVCVASMWMHKDGDLKNMRYGQEKGMMMPGMELQRNMMKLDGNKAPMLAPTTNTNGITNMNTNRSVNLLPANTNAAMVPVNANQNL